MGEERAPTWGQAGYNHEASLYCVFEPGDMSATANPSVSRCLKSGKGSVDQALVGVIDPPLRS